MITFDITNTNLQTRVSEQLFSDLACILTQNAIEACHAGDNIYIYMTSEQETPHGFGLYYLHKTVLRQRGTISTICTEHNGTYWMVFRLIL